MANRIYSASVVSIIAVNGDNSIFLLGLVRNFRMMKRWTLEGVPEWGSYRWAGILHHGYSGEFSWGRAFDAGGDLVSKGLVPTDQGIPQFQPIALRVIDQIAQRQIALIVDGIVETFAISADAQTKLNQDVAGQCITLLSESELN